MHKPAVIALIPIALLTITASGARLFNAMHKRPTAPLVAVASQEAIPVAPVLEQKDELTQFQMEQALRQMIESYRKKGFDSLKTRTTPKLWHLWHTTSIGSDVERRMRMLASWPVMTFQEPRGLSSGHTEAVVACDGAELRVRMLRHSDGWKLMGIVASSIS